MEEADDFHDEEENTEELASFLHPNEGVATTHLQQQGHGKRVIVHVDLDAYYAQCEMLLDPSLRDRPIGIQQKYLIVTCNYVARARGVKKLQSMTEAKKRCPEMVIVNGSDLTKYRIFSEKIHEVLKGFSTKLERLGMDETFLDCTDLVASSSSSSIDFVGHVYEPPPSSPSNAGPVQGGGGRACKCGCVERIAIGSKLAQRMRKRLFDQLGFTSCAGISNSKMLAKLAGEIHKPNAQTSILPGDGPGYVTQLAARKLPGCGFSTNQQLQALGINTVAKLRLTSLETLSRHLGERPANLLYSLAHGHDPSPVRPSALPKSMSEEDSFQTCSSREEAYDRLKELVTSLASRIEERRVHHNEVPRTLRLTLRQRGLIANQRSTRGSRQCSIPNPETLFGRPDSSERNGALQRLAGFLFEKMLPIGGPSFDLTLLNIGVTAFAPVSGAKKRKVGGEEDQEDNKNGDSPSLFRFVSRGLNDDEGTITKTAVGEASSTPRKQHDLDHEKKRSKNGTTSQRPPLRLIECERCGVVVRDLDMEVHLQYHLTEDEKIALSEATRTSSKTSTISLPVAAAAGGGAEGRGGEAAGLGGGGAAAARGGEATAIKEGERGAAITAAPRGGKGATAAAAPARGGETPSAIRSSVLEKGDLLIADDKVIVESIGLRWSFLQSLPDGSRATIVADARRRLLTTFM